jgi:hypothetical protein
MGFRTLAFPPNVTHMIFEFDASGYNDSRIRAATAAVATMQPFSCTNNNEIFAGRCICVTVTKAMNGAIMT